MKIIRFFKKLWNDLKSESSKLKSFGSIAWRSIILYIILLGGFWLMGKGVEVVGLHKYIPKSASGEELGTLLYGAIAFVALLIALGIFNSISTAWTKIKKTWNEV